MSKNSGKGKSPNRKRVIRKVGLDTSILVALLGDKYQYSNYQPALFRKKNTVFINQLVFNEAKYVLAREKNIDKKEAVDNILNYIHKHNINLIKPKHVSDRKMKSLMKRLTKMREEISINPPDMPDLKIAAIYKNKNIDCIVSLNRIHFKPICDELDIDLEVPQKDVNKMWKEVFGWRH